jgi:hypothetical protein
MKHLFDPCSNYREDLCAATSGDLAATDRVAMENHLKTCAGCQKYRDEIGSVTALMAVGGKLFANIEPRETSRIRWARDFEAAIEPASSIAAGLFRRFLHWSRDMVWPCRRIWAGMAAIWVIIACLNISQMTKEKALAAHRPSPEILRAFLAVEGFLPGPTGKTDRKAGAPKSRSPQPETTRQREN